MIVPIHSFLLSLPAFKCLTEETLLQLKLCLLFGSAGAMAAAAGSSAGDPTQAVIHGIAIVKASSSSQKATILNLAHNTSQFGFWGFGAAGT